MSAVWGQSHFLAPWSLANNMSNWSDLRKPLNAKLELLTAGLSSSLNSKIWFLRTGGSATNSIGTTFGLRHTLTYGLVAPRRSKLSSSIMCSNIVQIINNYVNLSSFQGSIKTWYVMHENSRIIMFFYNRDFIFHENDVKFHTHRIVCFAVIIGVKQNKRPGADRPEAMCGRGRLVSKAGLLQSPRNFNSPPNISTGMAH